MDYVHWNLTLHPYLFFNLPLSDYLEHACLSCNPCYIVSMQCLYSAVGIEADIMFHVFYKFVLVGTTSHPSWRSCSY